MRERERERDKRRDLDRERERLIPDSMERDRDRDRDRTFESSSQIESVKRSEAKLESEHERDLEGTSRDCLALDKEKMDKDLGSVQGFEDLNKAERTESVEGECLVVCYLLHSFSDFIGNKIFSCEGVLICIRKSPVIFQKCGPLICIIMVYLVQIPLNEIKGRCSKK